MKPLYTLAVLCALVAQAVCQTLSCNDDASISIQGLGAYNGEYVVFEDGICDSQVIAGGMVSDTGCTFDLDTAFNIALTTDSTYTIFNSAYFTLECTAASTATAYFSVSASPDYQGSDSDIVAATLSASVSPLTQLVGSQVEVEVALSLYSQDFYRFMVWEMTVGTTSIISSGCPDTGLVTLLGISVSGTAGAGQTTATVTFNAFFEAADAFAGSLKNYKGEVEVKLCTVANTASCFVEDGCASGTVDQYGRKRRQTENTTTTTTASSTFSYTVFNTEQSRQAFLDDMRVELGMTEATKIGSLDDICVPKTTSVVVLVFLIVGMVVCFLATIWMFVKMRKSRRLQDPDKSEFSYPNKSFKH